MQTAIALSMGETPAGQENGVTTATQHFGPSTRAIFDPQKWAMTVSQTTAKEVTQHPPAPYRKRGIGEPAFLKASAASGFGPLEAILTIYHAIPQAREALLLPRYQLASYGFDPQWWMGNQIEAPQTNAHDQQDEHRQSHAILFEVQRIMAFLDGSNRAYGSTDALADLLTFHRPVADSELTCFLDAWTNASILRCPEDPLTRSFLSDGVRNGNGRAQRKDFYSLELNVNVDFDQCLTDPLDRLIWPDNMPYLPMEDILIDNLGAVITMRLSDPERKNGKLGIEVPAFWYPDRYMAHFQEQSRDIRRRKRAAYEELNRLNSLTRGMLDCRPVDRQGTLDIKTAVTKAAEKAPVVMQQSQPEDVDMSISPSVTKSEVDDCVRTLTGLVATIDRKIAQLECEKKKIQDQICATARELNGPKNEAEKSQYHRYSLRGVSTKPSTTYVLHPSTSEGHIDDSTRLTEQWWRMSSSPSLPPDSATKPAKAVGPDPPSSPFPPQSTQQIYGSSEANGVDTTLPASSKTDIDDDLSSVYKKEVEAKGYDLRRVKQEDVLRAAREESDSIILVYASDAAVDFPQSKLSAPLQAFVKADNRVFENELASSNDSSNGNDTGSGATDAATTTTTTTTNKSASGEQMTQLHFTSALPFQVAGTGSNTAIDMQDACPLPSYDETEAQATAPEQLRGESHDVRSKQDVSDRGSDPRERYDASAAAPAVAQTTSTTFPSQNPRPSNITPRDKDGQPSPKRTKSEQRGEKPVYTSDDVAFNASSPFMGDDGVGSDDDNERETSDDTSDEDGYEGQDEIIPNLSPDSHRTMGQRSGQATSNAPAAVSRGHGNDNGRKSSSRIGAHAERMMHRIDVEIKDGNGDGSKKK